MRYVAAWLAAVIVVVFILQLLYSSEPFVLMDEVKFSEPWRLVTSIFAHGGIPHLLNNLFALLLFGLILEGRIGAKRTLLLFLAAGVAVNILSPYPRSLGASGAIFGILGALIALRPGMVVYVSYIPMPMFVAGIVWLLQDLFGIFYPTNVANLAHISGLFIGLAFGLLWRKRFGDKIAFFAKKQPKDENLERQLDEFEREQMLRK